MSKKIKYTLNSKFSVWFKNNYEDDYCADDINPKVTFKELLSVLEGTSECKDIYEAMGAEDSDVREALFDALSEITGKPYDYFDGLFLNMD